MLVMKPAYDRFAIAHDVAMLAMEPANKVQSAKLACRAEKKES